MVSLESLAIISDGTLVNSRCFASKQRQSVKNNLFKYTYFCSIYLVVFPLLLLTIQDVNKGIVFFYKCLITFARLRRSLINYNTGDFFKLLSKSRFGRYVQRQNNAGWNNC